MMGNNEERKISKISEGILIAIASAGAYLFAFSYEQGYVSYFDIPDFFIRININSILIFGSLIIGFAIFLIPVVNLITLIFPKNINREIVIVLMIVVYLALFAIFQLIIFGVSNWRYWIVLPILFFSYVVIYLIFPLISQRKEKTYIAKLEAQRKYDSNFYGFYDYLANNFGKGLLIIFALVILGINLSNRAGLAKAVNQENFLVTNTIPEMVVLRIYEDNIICALFDRNTKEVQSQFTVLKLAENPSLLFKFEKVGPLVSSNSKILSTLLPPFNKVLVSTLKSIFLYSLLGCTTFSLLVILLFRSRLIITIYQHDGFLKEKYTLKSYPILSVITIGIIILQLLFNITIFSITQNPPIFWLLFVLDLSLYLILFTFDTLVVDYFVLSVWRPESLHIPEFMNKESIHTHIRASIPVGILVGLVLTLISAVISTCLLR